MPPTVQSGQREQRSRKHGLSAEKRSELVCRPKYTNALPDIPFDPKFITYPFESNRFVQYNPTSLERSYKHELLTEHDLGVTIDLINPDTYAIDAEAYLDPLDEKLLEEDMSTPQDSKRSRHHAKNVSWLRRTEYISTEYNRFTPSSEKAETKIGHSIKKQFKEEDIYKDRESQIAAIEKTFEDVKTPITQHYSKGDRVQPLEVLEFFPDFENWAFPCAQVIFDTDPAPRGKSVPAAVEEMSQAMIRGMVDEEGDQFVGYFLPVEETVTKRKREEESEVDYVPEEEYDYMMAREYNWNVKNKSSRGYEENYFVVFKEDGVYYNELETRVRLSKRRAKGGQGIQSRTSRLVVKHRDFLEKESAAQQNRLMMLEPPVVEEEEEEEEEEAGINGDNELGGDLESGDEQERSGSEKEDESEKSGSEAEGEDRMEEGSEKEGSDAGSGSESEAEDENKDEEEIFGSVSGSGSESEDGQKSDSGDDSD
ncbi:RNA polymerase II-associated factor 1 homolog [Branchiostoma floridae x Branchiostoma belcheri]